MSKGSGNVLKSNYLQLLLVFAAFAVMALAAYFYIGRILREHLYKRADEIIYTTEANVKAGLSEAETTLLNSYYIVQGMIERNESHDDILDYLKGTTEWMVRRDQGLFGFYGIHGYIHGEFFDSVGLNPGDDFIPQMRPWYQIAIRSGSNVAYTTPYADLRTGETIVSAVRNIDVFGDRVGILTVDLDINWLVEYVGSLSLSADGYGMLISQNMTFIVHPDENNIGRQLQDLGGSYEDVARILRSGGEVSAYEGKDRDGNKIIIFFKKMSNDWYVGVVTPYSQFFHDLNSSAQILALLGVSLSLVLCFILLRLSAAKMRADEDSRAKSSFLASMSHEIRTPMNAITGMAELLLRGELSGEARGYVHDIKQASSNLLSIINDILDFSKIEAGKLEIIPVRYTLSSLLTDTVNIIRMRLTEKPIKFYSNIDSKIPNSLLGDEVRVRQILLNLLTNAVKYSEKGHIGLTIAEEKRESGNIYLKIAISDTGKGIKQEDQKKLFGDFTQFDTKKNMGIEGTGLGLAITKKLCLAMGGDITVESEYGKGSTFTVIIPQGIEDEYPIAEVEDALRKNVLVYETLPVFSKSVCWTLENLNVNHTLVTKEEDFLQLYKNEEWDYIFTGRDLYEKAAALIENADFSGKSKPPLALLAEWGTEPYNANVRYITIALQTLSIANILNGRTDEKGYLDDSGSTGVIMFTIPDSKILVVDDIATNLKVAEGLLSPYKAKVDICQSGAEAIDLVKKNNYDIVFMDHMMPEMDGIEATAIIRALNGEQYSRLPIIALTANAVLGMSDIFMEKGFNDFLAKPIDVIKLDEVLDKWIPDEKKGKREHSAENEPADEEPLVIPGVDVKHGILMTGGTIHLYRQVLTLFHKDASERLPLLQKKPAADELPVFITQVHALKSASAAIGASDISSQAANLEAAGKAANLTLIEKTLPDFAEKLAQLSENIRLSLSAGKNETENVPEDDSGIAGKQTEFLPLFRLLADSINARKIAEIDRILDELSAKKTDSKTKEILEKISDEILMSDFNKATEILNTLFINSD